MTTPPSPAPGALLASRTARRASSVTEIGIWVMSLTDGPRDEPDDQARRVEADPGSVGNVAHAPILVVDDDPAILSTVARILQTEGYAFATAVDGLTALTAVEELAPRLIILDMRMPVMDGWTFARELRARGYDIPIMVMTAASDARRWAAEIDAAAYVAKPFDLDELLDKIGEMLPDE